MPYTFGDFLLELRDGTATPASYWRLLMGTTDEEFLETVSKDAILRELERRKKYNNVSRRDNLPNND